DPRPRSRGGRLRPETISFSGTGGEDRVMATWLITGATGFLGRHVLDVLDTELLREGRTGDAILVLGRHCPAGWPEHRFVRADLNDPIGLREAIAKAAPDHVIHTAGHTPPAADDAL